MSHCRWVVISEDCYQQLGQSPQNTEKKAPVPDIQATKSISEAFGVPEKASSEITEVTVPTKTNKVTDKEKKTDWTDSVPPSFKKEAYNLLEKLVATNGFGLTSKGIVQINGKSLEDYSIKDFLRTACIPFNKTKVPIQFQDWLRDQGLTNFRNHLFKILPKWQNRYSWRKSTMEGRRELSEAPMPSIRKQKS